MMPLFYSCLVALNLVVFLFNYALSDPRAISKLDDLRTPRESDLCYVVIRSKSEKEHIEEKYGIKLQHGAGNAYYFQCLESEFYSRPLISNELSAKEQKEKLESYNKEYISKLAEDPSVTEVLYGEYPVKLIPFEYVKPSKSETSKLWHLSDNFGSDFKNIGSSSNVDVEPAWNEGLSGKDITILIVDDGLYTTHEDFKGRIDTSLNMDLCSTSSSSNDPSPKVPTDSHGTAVAGVAAGGMSDKICAIGPSYEATLAGRNLLCDTSIEFEDLIHSLDCDQCHIINNSWGESLCDSDRKTCDYFNGFDTVESYLKKYVTEYRNGYGGIYLFASGNFGDIGEYSSMHSFARSVYTLTVGAIEASGVSSYYSDPGPSLDISAPSNGFGTDGRVVSIYTTGITNTSSCNSGFGGTSSACPLVSGVIGLMLQKNPNLSYRDIRYIFAHYAKNIDLPSSDLSKLKGTRSSYWINNAYGARHNVYYGFGQADVELLVGAAANWKHVGDLSMFTTKDFELSDKNGNPSLGTVDSSHKEFVAKFTITKDMLQKQTTLPQNVETVSVNLDINFYSSVNYGDMTITIVSPSGTRSIVMREYNSGEYTPKTNKYKVPSIEFTSHQFFGESSLGTWSVEVQFNQSSSSLSAEIDNFSMNFYGVRNEITITSQTQGSKLYDKCYGITIDAYPSSALTDFSNNYDAYLLALTGAYTTTTKPISPASTWSVVKKLDLIPGVDIGSGTATQLSFLFPSEVKTMNYTKYRVMLTKKSATAPTTSDILGSYEGISKSPIFSFSSSEEDSICVILTKELTREVTLSPSEVSIANKDSSACLCVDGSNITDYQFRTVSGEKTDSKYEAAISVFMDAYDQTDRLFKCEKMTVGNASEAVNSCSANGCTKPLGVVCEGASDVSVVQQFNSSVLSPKFNKYVIYTGTNKSSKYSFNLLEFDIAELVIVGDFKEVRISNASIETLNVQGATEVSDSDYNNVVIVNSSIEKFKGTKLNNVDVSYSYVGNVEYDGKKLALKTFLMQKPYGVNATLRYTGTVIVDGKLLPENGTQYELKGTGLPNNTPVTTWVLNTENADITTL